MNFKILNSIFGKYSKSLSDLSFLEKYLAVTSNYASVEPEE
jgi:hypothetical protein